MYKIRPATPRDFGTICQLEKEAFPDSEWNCRKLDRATGSNRVVAAVVVDCHDSVIGFCLYRFRKTHVELLRAVVNQTYRRCHIGQRILRHIEASSRKWKLNVAGITVPDSALPHSHRWLLACGWEQKIRIPARMSDDGDCGTRFLYYARAPLVAACI